MNIQCFHSNVNTTTNEYVDERFESSKFCVIRKYETNYDGLDFSYENFSFVHRTKVN